MIVGSVSACVSIGGRRFCQRGFLELHIGMQINGRRLDGLVAQPKRDHGTVDAMVKQVHRQRVPQHVGRHVFTGQRGAVTTGDCKVLVEQILQAVMAQCPAEGGRKGRF